MFDIGWSELMVIGAVALVVIGPKDLPRVLYELGKWAGKARHLVAELRSGFDAMVREAGLEDVRREVNKAADFDYRIDLDGTSTSETAGGAIGPHPEGGGEFAALPAAESVQPPVKHLW